MTRSYRLAAFRGTLLLLCLLAAAAVRGRQAPQPGAVKVTVLNAKSKEPVEFATASLITTKDSTFVTGKLTAKDGGCTLPNVGTGPYLLKVSFIGFKTTWRPVHVAADETTDVGKIFLEEGLTLNDVTIKGEPVAIKVKQDTTEFNTAAFKAEPDATLEKGLSKLPGLEIDKDGNIKINGQPVQKVLVDGKEFFGDDPKVATKNLPYDAIAKVQLIDDKSEQSKVSDIDDGRRSKVINVQLKDDHKKGWFGNTSLAGGTENRYLGSMSLNRFARERQVNVLVLSNNVNQTGFTAEDNSNFGGGAVTGTSNEGLTLTNSAGINWADEWGKKNQVKITASYMYGLRNTTTVNETANEQHQLGSVFFNNNNSSGERSATQQRFGLRLSWQVDSLTNILLLSNNPLNGYNSLNSTIFAQQDAAAGIINDGTSTTDNRSMRYQTSGSLSVSRRLRNKKGNLSIFNYWMYNPSGFDVITHSQNNFYQGGKPAILVNRLETTDNAPIAFNGNVNVNRALGRRKQTTIFVSPTYNFNEGTSERNTLEYNPANGFYELKLDSLSNSTYTQNFTVGVNAGLSKTFKKGSIYLNPSFNSIRTNGYIRDNKYDERVAKSYSAFVPSISINYSPTATKRLYFSLSGNTNTPAIADLLLKQNNPNPLYIREGNPDLKLTTSLNGTLNFNTSDPKKKTYTSVSLQFGKSFNAVSRNSYFDKTTGITTSRPVNVDGNYSTSAHVSFNVPTKITGLRIGPSLNIENGRNYNFINGENNRSDRIGAGAGANMGYDRDKVDIDLSSRINFSYAANSLPSAGDNRYWSLDNNGGISFAPAKNWRIMSELSQRSYAGQNVLLVNAGLQRYLAQNNKMLIELRAFDLLDNNSDLYRYVSDTQVTTSRSNSLGRYVYLRATYKVNRMGGKK